MSLSWSRRDALAAGLALAATGCGYALAGRGSFLPGYIRTVGIPQLENRSTFYQMELLLTDKIRAEFIGRGKYRVVPDATGADAMLNAEITSVSVQPVALTEQQLASRYLFTIVLRASFTDVRTNEVLWSNDSLVFRDEYELTTRTGGTVEAATFVDQERTSLDRISNDIARAVVTAIVEAF